MEPWQEIAITIVGLILSIFGVAIVNGLRRAVALNVKSKERSLLYDALLDAIADAVAYTDETHVKRLKKEGDFGTETQQEMLRRATGLVWDSLPTDVAEGLKSLYRKGDSGGTKELDDLIKTKIEAIINLRKRDDQSSKINVISA